MDKNQSLPDEHSDIDIDIFQKYIKVINTNTANIIDIKSFYIVKEEEIKKDFEIGNVLSKTMNAISEIIINQTIEIAKKYENMPEDFRKSEAGIAFLKLVEESMDYIHSNAIESIQKIHSDSLNSNP